MSYRNKTYIAFASEDIGKYRLMTAWKANRGIHFNFFDAHDLCPARDTSLSETIKRRLSERLSNAKQVVLLASPSAKTKGDNGTSFLAHELKRTVELNLPIVITNVSDVSLERGKPRLLASCKNQVLTAKFSPSDIKEALECLAG